MFLNGEGGLTGCGPQGYSLVSLLLFLIGQSNTAVLLKNIFAFVTISVIKATNKVGV